MPSEHVDLTIDDEPAPADAQRKRRRSSLDGLDPLPDEETTRSSDSNASSL